MSTGRKRPTKYWIFDPSFESTFDKPSPFEESGAAADDSALYLDDEAPISEPAGSPEADPFNSVVDWLVPATDEQDAQ